jgi:hypothetical protein
MEVYPYAAVAFVELLKEATADADASVVKVLKSDSLRESITGSRSPEITKLSDKFKPNEDEDDDIDDRGVVDLIADKSRVCPSSTFEFKRTPRDLGSRGLRLEEDSWKSSEMGANITIHLYGTDNNGVK